MTTEGKRQYVISWHYVQPMVAEVLLTGTNTETTKLIRIGKVPFRNAKIQVFYNTL